MTDGRLIRVRGQVQGVGFRPFIWQLAQDHQIKGKVLNDAEGVLIHAWGARVQAFVDAIPERAPPLAVVSNVDVTPLSGTPPDGFSITASTGGGNQTRVTPDAATCADCLTEIRTQAERRYGYAFANCTHCGPRFTILNGLPYDRAKTSMAAFPMCEDCRAEYEAPADRRFHAQPVACAACGPRVWFEQKGAVLDDAPLARAAKALADGAILAIKGLGGFHLCCDATNAKAIDTLRQRKQRPTKPLALMAPMDIIEAHAECCDASRATLRDPAAPIVLLPKGGAALPDVLAPQHQHLGWMLPYTPLHHLLMDLVQRPLVMTSGNLSGQPQVIGNDEARQKLDAFADAFVMHDRDIARRIDDSVEREGPAGPMILRRARGRVPGTLALPPGLHDAPQIVAYGGQMKSAICLLKNGEALLSHHLGELDDALTYEAFLQADADYAALFDHAPKAVAVDLHPGFQASQHGAMRADALHVPLLPIQHHHAHLAACLAENAWPVSEGPVAGIILDGLGLGPDKTIWGGELLLGNYHSYERIAFLRPAPLVGGDMAQRQPWRNTLMRLDQADLGAEAERILSVHPIDQVRQAAISGINSTESSSAGRLFDAVAGALDLCTNAQSYEGEAAMALEAQAMQAPPGADAPYPFDHHGAQIDPAPMMRALMNDRAAGLPVSHIAARFHAGLARAFCTRARTRVTDGQAKAVALSGGCFQNATLLGYCLSELSDLPVLVHKRAPANDGSLALGQAAIAAAQLMATDSQVTG